VLAAMVEERKSVNKKKGKMRKEKKTNIKNNVNRKGK